VKIFFPTNVELWIFTVLHILVPIFILFNFATYILCFSFSAPDQTDPSGTVKASIYDTHWTYTNSMPRSKSEQTMPSSGNSQQQSQPPPPHQQQPSYMPGMTERKKKKGIMSIFSRKKEGKFRLVSLQIKKKKKIFYSSNIYI
jgi:hypothetical protein